MATQDELDDARVTAALGRLLESGAPFDQLPFLNSGTHLFPGPVMGALDGRYPDAASVASLETLVDTGRLSEPELSATIDGSIEAQAADSESPMRVELSGAYASTSLFDRKRTARPKMSVVAPLVAGHTWTTPAVTGTSNPNDTSDYALGDRCLTVTAGSGDASAVRFQVTGQDFDLTDDGLVLWFKITNRSRLTQFYLDVGDNTFANRFRLPMTLPSGGKSALWEGEWSPIWVPFAVLDNQRTGSPTRAGGTALRVFFGDAGGAGSPASVKFGGVATYKEGAAAFPNGVASFTFDDTWKEHATFAAPLLARKGFTATLFPIIGRLGLSGSYYTLADLQKMVQAYGFELGAHAMDDAGHLDVTGRPQATVEAEFRAMRQWAFDNGFPPMMSYAYPIGPFDKNGVESVRRYFGYGRTNDTRLMSPTSDLRYSASALVLGSSLSLSQAQAAIDAAVADGLWVNFVAHDLPVSGPSSNGWTQANFTALVDYCATAGIDVLAAGDVVNAL